MTQNADHEQGGNWHPLGMPATQAREPYTITKAQGRSNLDSAGIGHKGALLYRDMLSRSDIRGNTMVIQR